MDFNTLSNIEKIELFKIASSQKYSWMQGNDRMKFSSFEEYVKSIVDYAIMIANEL